MVAAQQIPANASPLERLTHSATGIAEGLNYAGEVSAVDAYEFLKDNEGVLVDVRTIPEWQFVGLPDLACCMGKLLPVSWKTHPSYALNPLFLDTIRAEKDITATTPLFFICRSGGRSLDAAITMSEAGYRYCFNVGGGFEGEADATGHRGTSQGWKASNLPWKQG